MYSADQVMSASLEYFGGDELAASVFRDKYALRVQGEEGVIFEELTPKDMHWRLAREFARIEAKYPNPMSEEYIFQLFDKFRRIVPQGSVMYGAGNHHVLASLSNCIVLESPEDSISGITNTGRDLANLYKRRCGVGFDISTLRPEGAKVNNSAGTTTGAWSFADYYSYITRMIGQNGRRGALMLTMDVCHPDIEKFVTMKRDLKLVTGANVSVRISDEFMRAVQKNTVWMLRWPCDVPENEAQYKRWIKARALWDLINESACMSGEPGLMFWDSYCRNLPSHGYPLLATQSTNPCGEVPLPPYDSCRLISQCLPYYVKNPFTPEAYFDMAEFECDTVRAMRLSDDLVDLEIEALTRIMERIDDPDEHAIYDKLRQSAINGRRTGLGTHGLGDTLIRLGIRYDDGAALGMADSIYQNFRNTAYATSVLMTYERGAFPLYDGKYEEDCEFIKRLPQNLQNTMGRLGRRNIALLTGAPTGSVAIESQCSSGTCEPAFKLVYGRRRKINPSDTNARVDFVDDMGDSWQNYAVLHYSVKDYMEHDPIVAGVWEKIQAHHPISEWDEELKGILPDYFMTANEISPDVRVKMLGTIQQYIDHGISTTLNLPEETTPQEIQQIYENAWREGLKGVTVYREGSRSGVLVDVKETRPTTIPDVRCPKRPSALPCDIHHVQVKGEKWAVLVGLLDGKPYEVFGGRVYMTEGFPEVSEGIIWKIKTRSVQSHGRTSRYDIVFDHPTKNGIVDIVNWFDNAEYGVMTRMISISLRHGIPPRYIIEQLRHDSHSDLYGFSQVMARVLKKYVIDGEINGERCLKCGEKLVFTGGCQVCLHGCGDSKCN